MIPIRVTLLPAPDPQVGRALGAWLGDSHPPADAPPPAEATPPAGSLDVVLL